MIQKTLIQIKEFCKPIAELIASADTAGYK